MNYISDSVMMDTLKKVQALQIEIIKTGRSAHVDAGHHDTWPYGETYISFELTIFEGTDIVKSFDFTAVDTEEILGATYDLAVAYTKYLQANV